MGEDDIQHRSSPGTIPGIDRIGLVTVALETPPRTVDGNGRTRRSLMKLSAFSWTTLAVLVSVPPVVAQYAGVPGDLPPVPDAYQLEVTIAQPYSSAFSIPGITDEEAGHMENPGRMRSSTGAIGSRSQSLRIRKYPPTYSTANGVLPAVSVTMKRA
jgi:hypothetical protein